MTLHLDTKCYQSYLGYINRIVDRITSIVEIDMVALALSNPCWLGSSIALSIIICSLFRDGYQGVWVGEYAPVTRQAFVEGVAGGEVEGCQLMPLPKLDRVLLMSGIVWEVTVTSPVVLARPGSQDGDWPWPNQSGFWLDAALPENRRFLTKYFWKIKIYYYSIWSSIMVSFKINLQHFRIWFSWSWLKEQFLWGEVLKKL